MCKIDARGPVGRIDTISLTDDIRDQPDQ